MIDLISKRRSEIFYIMNEEQLLYIAKQFANMFGINIRVYKGTEKIFYQSTVKHDTDLADLCIGEILKDRSELDYYIHKNYFYYGFINYENYTIVIGPTSELSYSQHMTDGIGYELGVPNEILQSFSTEIQSFCGIHLDTLIQIIILINFTLNRTMYTISDLRIKHDEQNNLVTEIKENNISTVMDMDIYKSGAKTISIENDIITKVKEGDVQGLIDGATKIPSVSSGQLAGQVLRHQKNFFIRLETIVSRAAYQAGVEANEIIAAEEKYITKCESLESIDRIKNLQYHMILDYADRVNKLKMHSQYQSKIVTEIRKYVKEHIYESLKTADIADGLSRNRSSLATEFKKQTGITLADYVKKEKVKEAKELLVKTNKVLSDISYLLGFSSQGHFCKVFKEIECITPTEYRNKNQR